MKRKKTMRTKRKLFNNSKLCQSVPQEKQHLPVISIYFPSNLLIVQLFTAVSVIAVALTATTASSSNLSKSNHEPAYLSDQLIIEDELINEEAPVEERALRFSRQAELLNLDSFGTAEHLAASPANGAFPDYDAYRPQSDPFNGGSGGLFAGRALPPEQQSYQRRALSQNGEPAGGGGSKTLISGQQVSEQQQQQHPKMGPQFIKEPPSHISYLNSSDLVVPCAASGNPAPTIVSWPRRQPIVVFKFINVQFILTNLLSLCWRFPPLATTR